MDNPLILAGLFGSGYYMYYYGIDKVKNYIIESVLEYLKDKNNHDISFKQFGKSESAVILFEYGGKQSKVHIPYNRRKLVSMVSKKVFLIYHDGERIEITHKPGVPYLISAHEMGGEKIVVEKEGKVILTYESDETPKYL